MLSLTASRMVYAAVLFFYRLKNQNHSGYSQPTSDNKDENVSSAYCRALMPTSFLNFLDMATWLHRKSCYHDSCHQDNAGLILGVGAATIKRVELGESVTLSTLIGILRGLDRLHQLESILFDSHMRTFKAQLNAETPSRIRIRKKTPQAKEKLPTATPPGEANATINEWYTSSASNSVVWSFTPPDAEKKS